MPLTTTATQVTLKLFGLYSDFTWSVIIPWKVLDGSFRATF